MRSRLDVERKELGFGAARTAAQWRDFTASYWTRVKSLALAMLGAPDYDRYLAHCATHHPDALPLARAEFFALRQDARFARGSSRCC